MGNGKMTATVEVFGTKATVKNGKWECEKSLASNLLDTAYSLHRDRLRYVPNIDFDMAKMAEKLFGAKIVSYEPTIAGSGIDGSFLPGEKDRFEQNNKRSEEAAQDWDNSGSAPSKPVDESKPHWVMINGKPVMVDPGKKAVKNFDAGLEAQNFGLGTSGNSAFGWAHEEGNIPTHKELYHGIAMGNAAFAAGPPEGHYGLWTSRHAAEEALRYGTLGNLRQQAEANPRAQQILDSHNKLQQPLVNGQPPNDGSERYYPKNPPAVDYMYEVVEGQKAYTDEDGFSYTLSSGTELALGELRSDIKDALGKFFPVSQLIRISGAPSGSLIHIRTGKDYDNDNDAIKVHFFAEGVCTGYRAISKDESGLIMNNVYFKAEEGAPPRQGSLMLNRQVKMCQKTGITRMFTHAAKSHSFNGYYSWIRNGYNTAVPEESKEGFESAGYGDCRTLRDLFAKGEDAMKWWKENGVDLPHCDFDASENSNSVWILRKYMLDSGLDPEADAISDSEPSSTEKPNENPQQVEEFPDPIDFDEDVWDRVWEEFAKKRKKDEGMEASSDWDNSQKETKPVDESKPHWVMINGKPIMVDPSKKVNYDHTWDMASRFGLSHAAQSRFRWSQEDGVISNERDLYHGIAIANASLKAGPPKGHFGEFNDEHASAEAINYGSIANLVAQAKTNERARQILEKHDQLQSNYNSQMTPVVIPNISAKEPAPAPQVESPRPSWTTAVPKPPVEYTTEDGFKYRLLGIDDSRKEETIKDAEALFQCPITMDELVRVSGAPSGSTINIYTRNDPYVNFPRITIMFSENGLCSGSRTIHRESLDEDEDDGYDSDPYDEEDEDEDREAPETQLIMHNDLFQADAGAPPRQGSLMLNREARMCRKLGISVIKTHAALGGGFNGYYTWCRNGYNSELPSYISSDLVDAGYGDCCDIHSLFSMGKEAMEWWKENGVDLNDAKFNTSENSPHMAILRKYMRDSRLDPEADSLLNGSKNSHRKNGEVEEFPDPIDFDADVWNKVWAEIGPTIRKMRKDKKAKRETIRVS